jgi:hypothetical protein
MDLALSPYVDFSGFPYRTSGSPGPSRNLDPPRVATRFIEG